MSEPKFKLNQDVSTPITAVSLSRLLLVNPTSGST